MPKSSLVKVGLVMQNVFTENCTIKHVLNDKDFFCWRYLNVGLHEQLRCNCGIKEGDES